jgi:hypothetical protein
MPCDCEEARAGKMGHLYVQCTAEPGCSSIWYRPAHTANPSFPAGGLMGSPWQPALAFLWTADQPRRDSSMQSHEFGGIVRQCGPSPT